ncbi:hypothetical protein [Pseudoduganella buxea]|uniref:Uncharacterized protein n=1 Tax=Pseudoduganella buxea TaxID=1949069 RepID=A0A6I3SRV7_9BURK|nr:hypothetical protein [Pseudoduganella buxea]MTV51824.1 hypothetical protein [Pseudoduganella buxea]GGB98929.1 hypothetical protein GCM10011572_21110 [Pseudoduganella buxea]
MTASNPPQAPVGPDMQHRRDRVDYLFRNLAPTAGAPRADHLLRQFVLAYRVRDGCPP